MHQGGDASLKNIEQCGYSDTKLHNTMFAFWFAKHFGPNVTCSSLDPGWVPTKMGGPGASDDINAAIDTYVMLAEGAGAAQGQTGKHWYQKRERGAKQAASDAQKQENLIKIMQEITGVSPK
jgi:NAD(P)-dependent dehydrogenase (short-subunit alcohol dehydrogenase family)